MKAALSPTDRITEVNGVPCRVWQGQTDLGIRFHAYVVLVAVEKSQDCAEFEKALKEVEVPRPEVAELAAIPLRRIL